MLKSLIRKFTNYKELKDLNMKMQYLDVKELYEKHQFNDDKQMIKCKKQYLYAIKAMALQTEDNSLSKGPVFILRDFSNFYKFLTAMFLITTIQFIYNFRRKSPTGASSHYESLLYSEDHIKSVDTSNITFDDVKGIDDCKNEINEIVEFLKSPDKYVQAGVKMPKGVLLTGSPGTGKTLLAKAIAGEAGVKFFHCSGSDFEEVFVGLGSKRIRTLFERARENAPCIIFIDEFDSIGHSRDSISPSQILNQLLVEMDGFTNNDGVVILAATNFPESLDSAVKRSGRFDKQIDVPVPDLRGRKEILDLYISKIKHDDSINTKELAKKTIGMTGADLANIVNLAALNSVKENRAVCNLEDFENAIDRIKIGFIIRSYSMSEKEIKNTIYHELGHAIVGYYTQGAGEIHKVTILPRGHSLGHTSILEPKENNIRTKQELMAIVDVCMGGRAAEEVFFGLENVTSGASSDLNNATKITYEVLKSGLFNDISGPSAINLDEIGDTQRNILDQQVSAFLDSSYNRAKQLILSKKEIIEKIAVELKEKETLSKEEFIRIINS
jgi:ATP-dependent metalloprotease